MARLSFPGNCPRSGFTMLEVLIAMAIFAMASIVLIGSYVNVLNSYHAAGQGLQGDQEVSFCRGDLMAITDLTTATLGEEYDTLDTPPVHIKWTADIELGTVTDVYNVVMTVVETIPGKSDPKTVIDTFTLWRPTWSQTNTADATTLKQTNNSNILALQGRQPK